MYKVTQIGKSSDTKIQFVDAISMNLTADLAQTISVANQLWAKSAENAEKMKKKAELLKDGADFRFTESRLTKKKSTFLKSSSMMKSENFQGMTSVISHKPVHHITLRDKQKKLASPYAVRNLT